jgi:hypothetical protein
MTKQQFNALWSAFKAGGAWYGRRGGAMGGAYRRLCERLAAQGIVSRNPPYPITRKGLDALRDACRVRWAKDGCIAYQQDLEEVEAAIAAADAARYHVKPADLKYRENEPDRFFIRDTTTGDLVRGRNHVLLSYKRREDADRAVKRLNDHHRGDK